MRRPYKWTAPIKAAAIDIFLDRGVATLTSIGRLAKAPPAGQGIFGPVYTEFMRLRDAGWMLTERTGRAGRGESPIAFDFSGASRFDDPGTLADVVGWYLAAAVPHSARRALRSALRALFELPFRCTDEAILQACRGVPATQLYAFVGDARARLVERGGLTRKSVDNHVTAVRTAVRRALEHDVVPVFFPPQRPENAWTAATDEAFPLALEGATAPAVRKLRAGMLALRLAHEAYAPGQASGPEAVTPESVNVCLAALRNAGEIGAAEAIGDLRQQLRHEAYRTASPVAERLAQVFTAATPPPPRTVYLQSPTGARVSGGWPDLLPLLEEYKFPVEWREFLEWYETYSTLSWRALRERGDEFPERLARRQLDQLTLDGRAGAIRAYLGTALEMLKLTPADVRPADVFGPLFQQLTGLLLAAWASKAADPGDRVSHESSMGAHHIVVGGGLVALAQYERARHQRGLAIRTRKSKGGGERVDVLAEEGADMTRAERQLFEAYRHAVILTKNLERDRKESTTGRGANTVKNIIVVARQTPHQAFIEAQQYRLAEVQRRKAEGTDGTRDFHELVSAAMENGVLLSTGFRGDELAHIRFDIQYVRVPGQPRDIALRPVDRAKNKTGHRARLREAYVPEWLEDEYLTRSRPYFMRDQHLADGRPDLVQDHAWMFVLPDTGSPYGCLEEKADGKGRDKRALKARKQTGAKRWKREAAAVFKRIGRLVPRGRQQFCRHVVRNVLGFAVYQRDGVTAAANFLGDKEASVVGHYGDVDGSFYDTSGLDSLTFDPGVSSRPAENPSTAVLEELWGAVETGEITRDQYTALKRRFRGSQAA